MPRTSRENLRRCSRCKHYKSRDNFYGHPGGKDGLRAMCKYCVQEQGRDTRGRRGHLWVKTVIKKTPGSQKDSFLKAIYGITLLEWQQMVSAQKSCCAICATALDLGRHTHVDHCHKTGAVRGILCRRCNLFLGYYEKLNIPDIFDRVRKYLSSGRPTEV